MEPIFKSISKVGIVVNNLMETVETYYKKYGMGPWNIWDINADKLTEIANPEETKGYEYRIAQTNIGNTLWELIEPRDKKSIFHNFLKTHGEGLYNLGYSVTDFDKAIDFFNKVKIKLEYGGNWFGKRFAYLDTYNDLKHIAEIYSFQEDFNLLKPSYIYPDTNESNKTIKPIFNSIRQTGIAILDIRKVAKTYCDKYGIGPWGFYKYFYPKSKDMYYNEEELFTQRFTTAAATIGEIEQELMEPGDDYNVYAEFIGKHGEGLQHISLIYNLSFDESLEFHKKMGHKIKQRGNINGAIFVYIDATDDLKIIVEPLFVPENFEMPDSDYNYPEK
jgi:methylmalonyl-CoA/ethylmalonyl-CoA epimerase